MKTASSTNGPASLGTALPTLPRDDFDTALLTCENSPLPERERHLLQNARILVAGCGSIGGSVVQPLVRMGAEHLVLAEPDRYELDNLNRPQPVISDIGRNKATVLAEWTLTVNPWARVRVDARGIVAGNADELASEATLVFDGIGITTQRSLACKVALHRAALSHNVPVISGYDVAGTHLIIIYDYRRTGYPVLDGRLSGVRVNDLDPLGFLARVIPLRWLPADLFSANLFSTRGAGPRAGGPPPADHGAHLLGVVGARVAVDLLHGRAIRRYLAVDISALPRPAFARWAQAVTRIPTLVRLAVGVRQYRRDRSGTAPIGISRMQQSTAR